MRRVMVDTGPIVALFDRDLRFIRDFMDQYRDLPADFADASVVALCRRLKCTEVATVDSEFDVYRLPDKRRLDNVFF